MREMDARVDVEGGLLELALAFEHVALHVEREQVGRADLAPVQPVAVQQEAAVGKHHAEVVAHALVQVQAHGEAESGRQVDADRGDFELVHRSHGPGL
jgi:hypothetical protein